MLLEVDEEEVLFQLFEGDAELLRQEAADGLERRLTEIYSDPALRESKRSEYTARLDFETKTIVQMGYSGYFLIRLVWLATHCQDPRSRTHVSVKRPT